MAYPVIWKKNFQTYLQIANSSLGKIRGGCVSHLTELEPANQVPIHVVPRSNSWSQSMDFFVI